MNVRHTKLIPAAFGLLATLGTAQDLIVEPAPQSRSVVVDSVTAHLGDGRVLEGATVVFRGGRIVSVMTNGAVAAVTPDAERIDGTGLHLYPGMISPFTRVGLSEIGSVSATQDYREIGDLTPEAIAGIAVNPDATTIPVTRISGVTTVGVFPSGGLLPGRASVVQLAGWTTEEMSVRKDAGLVIEWPTMPVRFGGRSESDHKKAIESQTERRREIDQAFADAVVWNDARTADPSTAMDLRFAAMQPALRKEAKVFLLANDVESILSSVEWAIGRGLDPVVVGGREADRCVEYLVETGTPVVVTGTHRLPSRRDAAFDRPFTLPNKLEEAGVTWALATNGGGYENERHLPEHAAKAVAYGLPQQAAIRAMTKSAAEILGVGDQLGTIEVGKRATLILSDGNPMELRTRIRALWIEGRRIPLESKQTRLANKYRQRYRQMGLR